jgi:AraC-like DNA-binding protein
MEIFFDEPLTGDRGQLDAWGAAIGSLFYRSSRGMGDDCVGVAGRLARVERAGMSIVEVRAPAGPCKRDHRGAALDGVDALFVSSMTRGHAFLDSGAAFVRQGPGDIVVWDAARSFQWTHESNFESVCVRIPRALWRIPAPQRLAQRLIPARSPVSSLAASLIQQVTSTDDNDTAIHLGRALIEVLLAGLDTNESPRNDSTLSDAKGYMLARLDCPELSPRDAAEAVGVSPRSLARLFASEGSTPARWLWEQRLAGARAMLEAGQTRRVSDAALAYGFTSFAHFSRAFGQAYGVTPGQMLKRGAVN